MKTKIMDGKVYFVNSMGNLVPEEAVKDIDQLRDQVVCTIAERISKLEVEMAKTKAECMSDIEQFAKISAERFGVEIGGKIGNIQLTSFDGETRVMLAQAQNLDANEGVEGAKKLIDEVIADHSRDSDADLRAIVLSAFRVKQGKMDVRRLLELRSYKVSDPRWTKAMDIISDSIKVVGTRPCLRIQKRLPDKKRFESTNLDFSSI